MHLRAWVHSYTYAEEFVGPDRVPGCGWDPYIWWHLKTLHIWWKGGLHLAKRDNKDAFLFLLKVRENDPWEFVNSRLMSHRLKVQIYCTSWLTYHTYQKINMKSILELLIPPQTSGRYKCQSPQSRSQRSTMDEACFPKLQNSWGSGVLGARLKRNNRELGLQILQKWN